MIPCDHNGCLVGTRYPIPTDPTERSVPGGAVIGCNRLRCLSCNIPVRNAPGLYPRTGDLTGLYDLLDPATSPAVGPSPERRLYFCRCSHWTEGGVQALEDDDPDSFRSSPNVPWRCEGHPLITLPHSVDGVVLETPADIAAFAHRALQSTDPYPGSLISLHARLAPPEAAVLTAAVLEALDALNPLALRFFLVVYHPPARARLVEVLTAAGPQSPVHGDVWRVLAPGIDSEEPVRNLARAFALAGNSTGELFRALAAGDPEWFHINATAMARANIGSAEELYTSFYQLPDDYINASPAGNKWFHDTRDVIRLLIADSITLDQALDRASAPLATWDGNELSRTYLRIFTVSQFGAMFLKSGEVEPSTYWSWHARTLARGGRVGASHTHSEVVWCFTDDDSGVWTKTCQVLRGPRSRLLFGGSHASADSIVSVSNFIDISPQHVHRGVHCTLADGRKLLLHEEHDNDPPDGPEYTGEAVDWESAWTWQLAADFATWLGVPYLPSSGAPSNSRRLAIRARILPFADEIAAAPSTRATCAIGRVNDFDLTLRWEPETGELIFAKSYGDRSWPRVETHGTAQDAAAHLRHFITTRRIDNAAYGFY